MASTLSLSLVNRACSYCRAVLNFQGQSNRKRRSMDLLARPLPTHPRACGYIFLEAWEAIHDLPQLTPTQNILRLQKKSLSFLWKTKSPTPPAPAVPGALPAALPSCNNSARRNARSFLSPPRWGSYSRPERRATLQGNVVYYLPPLGTRPRDRRRVRKKRGG